MRAWPPTPRRRAAGPARTASARRPRRCRTSAPGCPGSAPARRSPRSRPGSAPGPPLCPGTCSRAGLLRAYSHSASRYGVCCWRSGHPALTIVPAVKPMCVNTEAFYQFRLIETAARTSVEPCPESSGPAVRQHPGPGTESLTLDARRLSLSAASRRRAGTRGWNRRSASRRPRTRGGEMPDPDPDRARDARRATLRRARAGGRRARRAPPRERHPGGPRVGDPRPPRRPAGAPRPRATFAPGWASCTRPAGSSARAVTGCRRGS